MKSAVPVETLSTGAWKSLDEQVSTPKYQLYVVRFGPSGIKNITGAFQNASFPSWHSWLRSPPPACPSMTPLRRKASVFGPYDGLWGEQAVNKMSDAVYDAATMRQMALILLLCSVLPVLA